VSKRERQCRLIRYIALEPWQYNKQTLATALGMSSLTLERDLDELKARGYCFGNNTEGLLFLEQAGWGEYLPLKESTVRQLELMRFLSAHKNGLRLVELERMFLAGNDKEVGEKTIERAVKELERRELVSREGDKYIINRHKLLPPLQLGDQEKNLLFHAMTLARAASPWQEELQTLEAKLRVGTTELCREQSTIYIHGKTPGQDIRRSYYCRFLEQAARERRKITMLYRHGEGPAAEITVNPLGLVYYWVLDNWYLVAQTNDDIPKIKTYLLDRILAVAERQESFPAVADFELREWYRYAWGIFRQAETTPVKLRFYRYFQTLERVRAELAERQSCRLEEDEDGLIMYDQVEGLADLAVWLRAFGPGVVVLEPPELRAMVAADLEKLLELYGEGA